MKYGLVKVFAALAVMILLTGCASDEAVREEGASDYTPTVQGEENAEAVQESAEVQKEAPLPPPTSLGEQMARVAAQIKKGIPQERPWMILVTVKGQETGGDRYEEAVTNELVHQLQRLSGEEKSFMVTTPEIRKQILEEQSKSLSDFFNEESGVEVGNMVRADAVLKAPLEHDTNHVNLTLHLIAIETGAVVWSSREKIPRTFLPKEEKIDPEILYSGYKSGNHAIRTFPFPANTAELKVKVDRDTVYEGNTYNIECTTGTEGYLYLFDLQTDGTLAVLLPNQIPLEHLNGGFLDNYLPRGGRFTTKGSFELTASITGKETLLAVLTERRLDTSGWEKVYTELGEAYPEYHWYTFGRNGSLRDCIKMLLDQLNRQTTGYWYADWTEFSIVK